MDDQERQLRVFKALADRSRLEILECIQRGTSNPGGMARSLHRHRSTIEKHLRVLLKTEIVEKRPSLTSKGHLAVKYEITGKSQKLLDAIKEVFREF